MDVMDFITRTPLTRPPGSLCRQQRDVTQSCAYQLCYKNKKDPTHLHLPIIISKPTKNLTQVCTFQLCYKSKQKYLTQRCAFQLCYKSTQTNLDRMN